MMNFQDLMKIVLCDIVSKVLLITVLQSRVICLLLI
jgi:hypothetical protein